MLVDQVVRLEVKIHDLKRQAEFSLTPKIHLDKCAELEETLKVIKAELDTKLAELKQGLDPISAKIYMEIKTKERLPRALRWLKEEKEKWRHKLREAKKQGKSGYEERSFLKYYEKGIRKLTPLLNVGQQSKISRLIHAYACGLFEGELRRLVGWDSYSDEKSMVHDSVIQTIPPILRSPHRRYLRLDPLISHNNSEAVAEDVMNLLLQAIKDSLQLEHWSNYLPMKLLNNPDKLS